MSTKNEQVLVAHVSVADKTITVRATQINEALIAINGELVAGMRINAKIVFDTMTEAELAASAATVCLG